MPDMKVGIFNKLHLFFFGSILAVIALLVCFNCRSTISANGIGRVILISIDTCRADHLGCYGYWRNTTPNIDTIAAEGIVFNNAFTSVPITLPSHSSMLTGTIPLYHRVRENVNYRLSESNITLAEILQENGFETGAFVGAFVLDSQFGLDQGFDTYNDSLKKENKVTFMFAERDAEEVTYTADKWLEQHRDDKFFLFLHYFDPHSPYNFHKRFGFMSKAGQPSSVDRYDSEIAYTDDCIGKVIKKLKDLDLYDSTLLIITSDHGESLGEHSEKSHGYFIYNSTLHVPLIIKIPKGPKGKRIDDLAGLVDIVPTVCSSLGIPVGQHIQGRDLNALFLNESDSIEERFLYCESLVSTKFGLNPFLGLVSNGWKYIHTSKPELYDLKKDFREKNNLYAQYTQQGRIMQDKLDWILKTYDRSQSDSGNKMVLDEESKKRLESLGYISDSTVDDTIRFDENSSDPKKFIEVYNFIDKFLPLAATKKYDEAERLCNDMLAEWPGMIQVYYYLGLLAVDQKNNQAVITNFSKYLEDIDLDSGDFSVQFKPKHQCAVAHSNLGDVFQQKGQGERAVEHYKKALSYDPYMESVHSNLSVAYIQLGKHDLAINHLNKALDLDPDFTNALNNMAWLLASAEDKKIKNADEAVKLAQRACELSGYNNYDFLDTLSIAYAAAGRFTEAIDAAGMAVELARSADQEQLVREIKDRIEVYKKNQL